MAGRNRRRHASGTGRPAEDPRGGEDRPGGVGAGGPAQGAGGVRRVHGHACRRRTRSTCSSPRARQQGPGVGGRRATASPPKPRVVGLGTMGSGIAQAMLAAGLPVVALDQNASALAKGDRADPRLPPAACRAKARWLSEQADATLGRISTATRIGRTLPTADWSIEAVFEEPGGEAGRPGDRLEEVCRPDGDPRHEHVHDLAGCAGRRNDASGAAGRAALLPPRPDDAAGGGRPPPDARRRRSWPRR